MDLCGPVWTCMDLHGLVWTLQIAEIWSPLRSAASPKALVYVLWCFGTLPCHSRRPFDRFARTEFLTSAAMSANARRQPAMRSRTSLRPLSRPDPSHPTPAHQMHASCTSAPAEPTRRRSRAPRHAHRRKTARAPPTPATRSPAGATRSAQKKRKARKAARSSEREALAARARSTDQALGRAGRQMRRGQRSSAV